MGKLDAKTGGVRSPAAAQNTPTQTSEERRWKAEEALHTVKRYHEIAGDQSLMGDVSKLARQQAQHLMKVADHASGATTRTGSSPDKRTPTVPPKAASKGGSSGGGSKEQGRRSGKKVK